MRGGQPESRLGLALGLALDRSGLGRNMAVYIPQDTPQTSPADRPRVTGLETRVLPSETCSPGGVQTRPRKRLMRDLGTSSGSLGRT
jgi:hypothetical protein